MSSKRNITNDQSKSDNSANGTRYDLDVLESVDPVPQPKRARRNAIKPNSKEAKEIRNVAVNYLTETILKDIATINVDYKSDIDNGKNDPPKPPHSN